jgi:hypothetical protein
MVESGLGFPDSQFQRQRAAWKTEYFDENERSFSPAQIHYVVTADEPKTQFHQIMLPASPHLVEMD